MIVYQYLLKKTFKNQFMTELFWDNFIVFYSSLLLTSENVLLLKLDLSTLLELLIFASEL